MHTHTHTHTHIYTIYIHIYIYIYIYEKIIEQVTFKPDLNWTLLITLKNIINKWFYFVVCGINQQYYWFNYMDARKHHIKHTDNCHVIWTRIKPAFIVHTEICSGFHVNIYSYLGGMNNKAIERNWIVSYFGFYKWPLWLIKRGTRQRIRVIITVHL